MTTTIELAGVRIRIEYNSEYVQQICADYVTNDIPELYVEVTAEDIQLEKRLQPEHPKRQIFSEGYMESLTLYRKICNALLPYDVFLFHCSAVAVDGKAYLFAAPSGTGKSTHTSYWRQVYGEHAVMVNDDKPLIRCTEEGIYVYGTPWNGKHNLSTNMKAPVAAICILERGEKNRIEKISLKEAYPMLLNQTYRPKEADRMAVTLQLINKAALEVPLYRMQCNMSEAAARMAYQTMSLSMN
jgi:hypothetical protein